jgi:nucleotide-binding universal stress UspA family protein
MFRKVLVPLDGSELAERALPYACRLAGTLGRLVLIRAAGEREPRDDVRTYLDAVAARLQQGGAATEWHVYYGSASGAIGNEAALQRADTVVMSTHGRSGVQRLVCGSVAEQVLHEAEVPVLLVPARANTAWDAGSGRRIVIPLDGSALAEAALEPAIVLAGRLRAALLLVGVVQPLDLVAAGYDALAAIELEPRENQVSAYLESVAAGLRQRGLRVATLAEVGQPAVVIARLAAQAETAAVAIATHGRRGLAQLVLGSVTSDLVRHATAPLLVVRPYATERAAKRVETVQLHGIPALAGGIF